MSSRHDYLILEIYDQKTWLFDLREIWPKDVVIWFERDVSTQRGYLILERYDQKTWLFDFRKIWAHDMVIWYLERYELTTWLFDLREIWAHDMVIWFERDMSSRHGYLIWERYDQKDVVTWFDRDVSSRHGYLILERYDQKTWLFDFREIWAQDHAPYKTVRPSPDRPNYTRSHSTHLPEHHNRTSLLDIDYWKSIHSNCLNSGTGLKKGLDWGTRR